MAPKPIGDRKRDKFMQFIHWRPRTPQPTEPSIDIPATQPPATPEPPTQSAGTIVLNPHDTELTATKAFTKGESFKKDMAILSIAYTLQESSELKRLIQLIVVIHNNDSKGQLTEVLKTCARFSVQLASATDAQRAEAIWAITAFNETVTKLMTIPLNGDGKSLDGLMDMIKGDIERIKPSFMSFGEHGTSEKLSKVLDTTIEPTISILSLVKEASSLIPVPWVRPLIGIVVSMLQAVSQTRSNYSEMKQVAATAGEFVLSCAVICSESKAGPSEELKRALNEFTKWGKAVVYCIDLKFT